MHLHNNCIFGGRFKGENGWLVYKLLKLLFFIFTSINFPLDGPELYSCTSFCQYE